MAVFIQTALFAGLIFFGLYYLFRSLIIYRKIDKHFYFVITSFAWAGYIFFQMFMGHPAPEKDLIFYHKMKLLFLYITAPFFISTIFGCFYPEGKRFLAYFMAALLIIFAPLLATDLLVSAPVKQIVVVFPAMTFAYNIGTTQSFYSIYSVLLVLTFISAIVQERIGRKKMTSGSVAFIVIFLSIIAGALNDFAVSHRLINNIMLSEYLFFAFIFFVYVDFLLEDLGIQKSLINAKNALEKQRDEAERRLRITQVYTRKSIVDNIASGLDPVTIAPQEREVTLLFSDIRNFTRLSEGMDPLSVVNFLNDYFSVMNEVIMAQGGEIDKLMGDCIMAIFPEPKKAVAAAVEMRRCLSDINKNLTLGSDPVDNGIGIHSGKVIMGNIGSTEKLDFTVIGDIVNTASRLEALTKTYGVPIIVTKDSLSILDPKLKSRFLDKVLVKGKQNVLEIYEVWDTRDEDDSSWEARQGLLLQAWDYYIKGEFDQAQDLYQQAYILAKESSDQKLVRFYYERTRRLAALKLKGLLQEWTGVYEHLQK